MWRLISLFPVFLCYANLALNDKMIPIWWNFLLLPVTKGEHLKKLLVSDLNSNFVLIILGKCYNVGKDCIKRCCPPGQALDEHHWSKSRKCVSSNLHHSVINTWKETLTGYFEKIRTLKQSDDFVEDYEDFVPEVGSWNRENSSERIPTYYPGYYCADPISSNEFRIVPNIMRPVTSPMPEEENIHIHIGFHIGLSVLILVLVAFIVIYTLKKKLPRNNDDFEIGSLNDGLTADC